MIIDSKFHDYYDPVASQGIDKTIVYKRVTHFSEIKREESLFDKMLFQSNPYFSFRDISKYISLEPFIVMFCGRIHLGVKYFSYYINEALTFTNEYNLQKILSLIETYEPKGQYKYWKKYSTLEKFKLLIEAVKSTTITDEYFRNFDSPCIIEHLQLNNKIVRTINPKLQDWGFQHVVDPYTAFQEIQMYISNFLVSDRMKVEPISDKLKAQSKGFNDLSFRKQSHQRKSKK